MKAGGQLVPRKSEFICDAYLRSLRSLRWHVNPNRTEGSGNQGGGAGLHPRHHPYVIIRSRYGSCSAPSGHPGCASAEAGQGIQRAFPIGEPLSRQQHGEIES